MQMEEITLALRERGAVWQAVGFAALGAASTSVLSVYSDSDHWIMSTYRIGATQQQWAFLAIIALAIEGVRTMFEKATEIRRRYSAKADAKAEAKGEAKGRTLGRDEGRQEGVALGRTEGREEERERFRAELRKRGIELTEEDEKALFNPNGRKN